MKPVLAILAAGPRACLAAALASAMALPAHAQYRPEVPITRVFHQGDPVPGLPGVTFSTFAPPQIDGAGNVLLRASMSGPEITPANNVAIWYGPPGEMSILAREGDPAVGLPSVIYANLAQNAVVSENGVIAFVAYLSGAGITPGVNDRAAFYGTPGNFVLAKRTGEAVPEVGPGITISGTQAIGVALSDNGTLLFSGQLTGDGLPVTPYHMVRWVGTPGAMELVAWDGMPAPGCYDCEPGDYLYVTQLQSFNDVGVVTMQGTLSGPGVWSGNGEARWIGPPGGLEIMYRTGRFAPEFGPGVAVFYATGILNALNNWGDQVNRIRLIGPGVTDANDWVLVAGEPGSPTVIAREADLAPEAGSGAYLAFVGDTYINDRHEVLYYVRFGGPGVDASNDQAVYFGPYDGARLIFRLGDPAPYLPGARWCIPAAVVGRNGMNDVGDFATTTSIHYDTGPAVSILWLWRSVTGQFVPLVEEGGTLGGRVLATELPGYVADYCTLTGGADGCKQSFNDRRQVVVHLAFTDGTYGVYRIGPPLLGDMDGDGAVTTLELVDFAEWMTGPGGEAPAACAAMDLDLDADLDLADYRALQAMVGEAR